MSGDVIAEVLRADVTSVVLLAMVLVTVALVTLVGVGGTVVYRVITSNATIIRTNTGMLDNLRQQTATLGQQTDHLSKQTVHLETLAEATHTTLETVRNSRDLLVARIDESKQLQSDMRQDLLGAMASNQRDILAELKPVAETLTVIGLGVDTLNKAILEHRQNEKQLLDVLQHEQASLMDSLSNTQKTLKDIWERMICDLPLEQEKANVDEVNADEKEGQYAQDDDHGANAAVDGGDAGDGARRNT